MAVSTINAEIAHIGQSYRITQRPQRVESRHKPRRGPEVAIFDSKVVTSGVTDSPNGIFEDIGLADTMSPAVSERRSMIVIGRPSRGEEDRRLTRSADWMLAVPADDDCFDECGGA